MSFSKSLKPNYKFVTFKFDGILSDYLKNLMEYENYRLDFINKILSTGYDYCFLEFPPLRKHQVTPAEFTIIESKPFSRTNWSSFKNELMPLVELSQKNRKYAVCYFSNLSKDTTLVCPVPGPISPGPIRPGPISSGPTSLGSSTTKSFVPLPGDINIHSGHLIDFLKNGNKGQVNELIKLFSRLALEISNKTKIVYISTHGHGVPWLHVRLSQTPKYYTHTTYSYS
jgi:hypothetical protein